MSNMVGKVIKDYDTPYPEPFVIKKGELLRASEKDSEWKGWIWCTNAEGKSAWVPESYLAIEDKDALALNDYNARELSVRAGDRLDIIKEEAEWFLCRDMDGKLGWVPGNHIELID